MSCSYSTSVEYKFRDLNWINKTWSPKALGSIFYGLDLKKRETTKVGGNRKTVRNMLSLRLPEVLVVFFFFFNGDVSDFPRIETY